MATLIFYICWLCTYMYVAYSIPKQHFSDYSFFERNFVAYEAYVVRDGKVVLKILEAFFSVFVIYLLSKENLNLVSKIVIFVFCRPNLLGGGFNYRSYRGKPN